MEELAYRGADAFEATGREDAARHMRHFLGESGEPLAVDAARMLRDIEFFRTREQTERDDMVRDIQAEAARRYQGDAFSFTVEDRGWTGKGKSVNIGAVTISDEELQGLHRAGLAQDFDVYGTTDTEAVTVDADRILARALRPRSLRRPRRPTGTAIVATPDAIAAATTAESRPIATGRAAVGGRLADPMRLLALLALGALVVFAGCERSAEPVRDDGSRGATRSYEPRPITAAQAARYARVELPPGASDGQATVFPGPLDDSIALRFTIPRSQLDAMRSILSEPLEEGYRTVPDRPDLGWETEGSDRVLGASDIVDGIGRDVLVDLDVSGRPVVYLTAGSVG